MFTVQQNVSHASSDILSFFSQQQQQQRNNNGVMKHPEVTRRPAVFHPGNNNASAYPQQQQPHQQSQRGGRGSGASHQQNSNATSQLPSLSAADKAELLSRTIHLRFLPTGMRQGDLATMCVECGPVNRVRICGGQNNPNQNWIYGFVEFIDQDAAHKMMKKSGMELHNGSNKPPLRLKCHCAREPIVDRVFHDADVAKGIPCQFGSGAFASRTLKEALDSYFNLVTKAGGAALLKDSSAMLAVAANHQQQQLAANFNGSVTSMGSTGMLTPHTTFHRGGSITPSSAELRPLALSDSSSVNGRTPSNPPSPPMTLPPSSLVDFTTNTVGRSLTQPPPSLFHHTGSNNNNKSFIQAPPPPPPQADAKLSQCMSYMDSAMRAGAAFAATKSATSFFEAMGPLLSLHETLNTIVPRTNNNNASSAGGANAKAAASSVDDAQLNMVRGLRISAYIIATFLHQIRGSLSEMLPCISKAMDVIANVTVTPLEKPSAFHVDPSDHEDDDAAFLSALSLVHVSQPSAVISQHVYETALAHQTFLVNALLAIGFGMENVNCLIARCAFTSARRRASAVLGSVHPELDRGLMAGGVHNLYAQLMPAVQQQQRSTTVGDFATHFFTSYRDANEDTVPAPTMESLPPLHCVAIFPHKSK
ncbi:RNA-binding protein, putative [Bodo saltans]|uniref:RNA-binding protein, putative n=1 Tax=Bodo saltans TaxID=75058 RepID=A0A0S4ITF0_BODSA|nr:RNA-binding protein, putative [Bodo saltans]|eukprot:CUF71072.1 RNA-binding protein, putative [Bodo saltans]